MDGGRVPTVDLGAVVLQMVVVNIGQLITFDRESEYTVS